jgi:hypothetical protein
VLLIVVDWLQEIFRDAGFLDIPKDDRDRNNRGMDSPYHGAALLVRQSDRAHAQRPDRRFAGATGASATGVPDKAVANDWLGRLGFADHSRRE